MRVLREKADLHQAKAGEHLEQSAEGLFPNHEAEAKSESAKAGRLRGFIGLLRDYQKKTIPLETIQVKLE